MKPSAEHVLDRLDTLLDEEHAALCAMEAAKVGELAAHKEVWFTRLVDSGAFDRPELKPRLRALSERMRKNALLITYARDLTSDALTALGAIPAHGYGRTPARPAFFLPPGRTLSTTG